MIQLRNPQAPATSKQLWLLHLLTRADTRHWTLTMRQASDMIENLKNGHKVLIEKVIDKMPKETIELPPQPVKVDMDSPYWWQTAEAKTGCLLLCSNCRHPRGSCKRGERWTGWKLPARTVKAFGSTMHFKSHCNIRRASLLKAMHGELKRKCKQATYPLPASHWISLTDQYGDGDEPTIEVTVNGKTLSLNGNYKPGMIREFVKAH